MIELWCQMLIGIYSEGENLLEILIDSRDVSNVVCIFKGIPKTLGSGYVGKVLLNRRGKAKHNASLCHVLRMLPGSMELFILGLLLFRNLFRFAIFIDRCRKKRLINGAC